jgi:hypothetical protein
MEKTKPICDTIRWFDFFGESFTFRYKDEDKHASILGGIICIIFYIIAFLYFIYNFIPFIKRENFSLQYYTMNLEETEKIKLAEETTAFAFGLTDNSDNKEYNISNLFKLNIVFVESPKGEKKTEKELNYTLCDLEKNYNNKISNKTFYDLKINELNCLSQEDLEKNILKGIYTDDFFSYYDISVESLYQDNETHNNLINDYLMKYDCKLQFYYTDISLDLNNVDEPFSSFLNSLFLQLVPTLVQKKNILFMNYHLFDDNLYLHIGGDDKIMMTNESKTGLSRVEDYFLYKGLERTSRNYKDDMTYAKMYIRVDNRKVVVKRRYQDFMEFYADTSALLLSIFWILGVIFAYYDRIKANHSISKKLFYFEGITDNKFQKFKELKEILNSDEESEKNNKKEEIQSPNSVHLYLPNNDHSNNNAILNNGLQNGTKMEINSDKIKKEEDKNLIDYSSYNIFEMIWSFKLCCCKTKNFKNKVNIFKQARIMIDRKLDIVFYIRNMILFEYINKISLNNKSIINFLSRPIIYINGDKKEKNPDFSFNDIVTEKSSEINEGENKEKTNKKLKRGNSQYIKDELYKSAYRLNSDKLVNKITRLVDKVPKTKEEEKIIECLKDQLIYV